MRKFIVGDVHGCLDEMLCLIDELKLTARDHLYFIGDLVDKGPYSTGVLEQVLTWHESAPFRVTTVLGNHEEKHIRYAKNPERFDHTSRRIQEIANIQSEWSPAQKKCFLSYLQQCPLYAFLDPSYTINGKATLLIHGGLPGNLSPEKFHHTISEWDTLSRRQKKHFMMILRTRFLNPQGQPRALGQEQTGDSYWAHQYNGELGHIIFGHQIFPEVAHYTHATGIDTGAVHGHKLSCMMLRPEHSPEYISVKARARYADPMQPEFPNIAKRLTIV